MTMISRNTPLIRADVRSGFHALAERTQRDESELINEVLSTYLGRQSRKVLINHIKATLGQQEHGDFDVRKALEEGRD